MNHNPMDTQRFTVTALNQVLRDLFGQVFPHVEVVGEIGSFTAHRSGHWYLSLKDEGAVLNAVFFRGANRRMTWTPRIGERVLAVGSLDVYPPQGRYNLIIRQMKRFGAGDLQARLEALKRRLTAEGLFDPARKRALPAVPRAIGLVTSPTGAAIRDVLRVTEHRYPGFPVFLSPCRVQGEGAAQEVARAIRRLNDHGVVDIIIVTRGGGAVEDLWTFNEEAVVRAVVASRIPVVCAIGHEADVSLAELAADVRGATPSHAAELVIPEKWRLQREVERRQADLLRVTRHLLQTKRRQVTLLRLVDPRRRLAESRIRTDEQEARLNAAFQRHLRRQRDRLQSLTARLRAVSPLAVLGRGYSIVLHEGHPVRDAATLRAGQQVTLRFSRGEARADILSVSPGQAHESS